MPLYQGGSNEVQANPQIKIVQLANHTITAAEVLAGSFLVVYAVNVTKLIGISGVYSNFAGSSGFIYDNDANPTSLAITGTQIIYTDVGASWGASDIIKTSLTLLL